MAMAPSTCLRSSMVYAQFRLGFQAHNSVSRPRVMHVMRCSNINKGSSPAGAEATAPSGRSTKQELSCPDIDLSAEATSKQQSDNHSLASLFVFDGAAPETINGRVAMVGFMWALVAEKLTGLTVVEQLFNPSTSGLLWFGAVVQLFAFASIIPFANGQFADARRWGPFNAKAERWNGRLAMIGFASLLLVEIVRQAPLIHI